MRLRIAILLVGFLHAGHAVQAGDNLCDFVDKSTASASLYSWPVKNFIPAKAINSIVRGFGGYGDSFHNGLDLKTPLHEPVCLPFKAKVTYLGGGVLSGAELNLLDEFGNSWGFAHLSHSSVPAEVMHSFRDQTYLEAGTFIGRVEFLEDPSFHHLHIEVKKPGFESISNPLIFLKSIQDTMAPEILDLYLFNSERQTRHDGQIRSGTTYTLALKTRDLISDYKHPYYVPPYRVSFSIDKGPSKTVWRFDQTPPVQKNSVPFDDLAGKYFLPTENCSETNCKEFVIDLGFKVADGLPSPFRFPDKGGNYEIEVFVEDFSGNMSSRTLHWEVLPE